MEPELDSGSQHAFSRGVVLLSDIDVYGFDLVLLARGCFGRRVIEVWFELRRQCVDDTRDIHSFDWLKYRHLNETA